MIFFQSANGKVLDRMDDLDAGVGHEDVDTAEGGNGLLDAGVHLLLVGDIHGHRDRSLVVAQLARRRRRRVEVEVGDGDPAARLDIAPGDGVADAAGRTGDEGNLAVEFHDACSFSL